MPRTSSQQYLATHAQLRRFWRDDPGLFAELPSRDQLVLHRYFQPSHELSDVELLEHRAAVSAESPALPQQAGRALSAFYGAVAKVGVRRVERAKEPAPAMGARPVRVLAN